jgi:hypothetical protein
VAGEDPAARPIFSQDECTDDPSGPAPTELLTKHRAKAYLDVEASEHVLQITNPTLDLNHEKRPRRKVPCQEVTSASITEMVETDLRLHEPSRPGKALGSRVLHMGMSPIKQPIEIGTLPTHFQDQSCVDSLDQFREGANRQSVQLSALGPGDGIAGQPCAAPQIHLAPGSTPPKCTDRHGHVRAHWPILTAASCPFIIGRLVPAFR